MTGDDPVTTGEQPAGPILIIDDDSGTRLTIQWALEEVGFVVETALDGIQGLERAASVRPALVILDLRLPGVDGTSVAAQLRASHETPPPILLITADDRAEQRARQIGAYAYLSKPFDLDDLVAEVQRGLAGARL
jgi:DNA-binding response OmpR family regulator